MVGLVAGYYFYLSNRDVTTPEQTEENQEYATLVSRQLDGEYYPESPRDVVTFYSRIVKECYYKKHTDEEIKKLGSQARKLFDKELLDKNPEDEFYDNLLADVREYNELERKIHGYTVQKSSDINRYEFEGKEYATVSVGYLVREKGTVEYIYQDYTLRKGEDGKWKILFWEKSSSLDKDNE